MDPLTQRLIALDEGLDEIILSRSQRLAEDIEFAAEPEERRGMGAGGAAALLAGAGVAGTGAKYGWDVHQRMKKGFKGANADLKGWDAFKEANRRVGGRWKRGAKGKYNWAKSKMPWAKK